MKNLRFWAYTSAFLSLFASVAMIGLWISGVWELKVVELNTFIGIIVSLLAIIVTLAIAWQIYNAIDLKNKVEELKHIEDRIKKQEKSLEQFKYQTTDHIFMILAQYSQDKGDYNNCTWCLLKDIEALLQIDDVQIEQIELTLNWLKSSSSKIKEIDLENEKRFKEKDKSIRDISGFKFIKSKYEPIFNTLISKVKSENTTLRE